MSVYRVGEIVGTSKTSWEGGAKRALTTAGARLRDFRAAEVVELDITAGAEGEIERSAAAASVSHTRIVQSRAPL